MIAASSLVLVVSVFASDGIVQDATKNATKGAVKAAQQSMSADEMTKGAKQVSKGVLDGVSDAAPLLGSQVMHQADRNKKLMGQVAQQVAGDTVKGVFGASVDEMNAALGPNGDGPLAVTMAATTERVTAAAVRGAKSQLQFSFGIWPLVGAFALGGLSTLVFGGCLMLLYALFQRRRVQVDLKRRA